MAIMLSSRWSTAFWDKQNAHPESNYQTKILVQMK